MPPCERPISTTPCLRNLLPSIPSSNGTPRDCLRWIAPPQPSRTGNLPTWKHCSARATFWWRTTRVSSRRACVGKKKATARGWKSCSPRNARPANGGACCVPANAFTTEHASSCTTSTAAPLRTGSSRSTRTIPANICCASLSRRARKNSCRPSARHRCRRTSSVHRSTHSPIASVTRRCTPRPTVRSPRRPRDCTSRMRCSTGFARRV